jgi:hypothetical protein
MQGHRLATGVPVPVVGHLAWQLPQVAAIRTVRGVSGRLRSFALRGQSQLGSMKGKLLLAAKQSVTERRQPPWRE